MGLIADAVVPEPLLEACALRLSSLRAGMQGKGIEALHVTNSVDVVWLTGTHGHDTSALVLPDALVLISDRRYEEYLAPWEASGRFKVELAPRTGQLEIILRTLGAASIATLGIQAGHVTLARQRALASGLEGIELEPVEGLIEELRQPKDPLEIDACSRAIDIQHQALEATLAAMEPGWTEGRFAARLIEHMRSRGAECEAFEPIIGSGPNSSVIHHVPSDKVIEPGILLVDWGARVEGRNSDLTRTLFLGEAPAALVALFQIVQEAHDAAVAACGPCTSTVDVDAAARDIIDAAGHGDAFPHGVGHGLGLDVHESPFMGRAGGVTTLQPGMIVTVEPGIYLPGVGGVRIENDILITEDGHRNLSYDVPWSLDWATRPWPESQGSGS
ncbi:MAG: Xaa-Pro peptidase family protein [Phycisphaerales bacterium]|nr:Xaa-Pro peptidase family protein [Phycisphaerales bacterium]